MLTRSGLRSTATSSKTYILRSILPAPLIEAMASPNAELAAVLSGSAADADRVGDRDATGVALDWQQAGAELGSMGLLFLILSLILVNGRALADGEWICSPTIPPRPLTRFFLQDVLRSYLRRLSLEPQEPLPTALQPNRNAEPTMANEPSGDGLTLEDWLALLVRQSYLECTRASTAQFTMAGHEATLAGKRMQARGASVRKGRGGAAEMDVVEAVEWRWGSRAEAEITEKAVADFVADVFLHEEVFEEDDVSPATRADRGGTRRSTRRQTSAGAQEWPAEGEANRRDAETRRQRDVAQIAGAVERAAGSPLIV